MESVTSTNIDSKPWVSIDWEKNTVMAGLLQLRERSERQALDAVTWYYQKKKSKNFWSRWLRFWTITFTVLGGMVPILAATGLVDALFRRFYGLSDYKDLQLAELHFNQFGYVLIGLAAGCIAFDRFFGFSTNWMRYIGAAMRIETARVKFHFDWEHLAAGLQGSDPNPDQVQELLDAIEKFSLAIREAIEQETGAWISEFQTNLNQLGRETKELFEGARNEKRKIEQNALKRKRL